MEAFNKELHCKKNLFLYLKVFHKFIDNNQFHRHIYASFMDIIEHDFSCYVDHWKFVLNANLENKHALHAENDNAF